MKYLVPFVSSNKCRKNRKKLGRGRGEAGSRDRGRYHRSIIEVESRRSRVRPMMRLVVEVDDGRSIQ